MNRITGFMASVAGIAALAWGCSEDQSRSDGEPGAGGDAESAPTGASGDAAADADGDPASAPLSCPAGQAMCGDACVLLDSNAAHCGTCSNACPPGIVCVSGVCGCPADRTSCAAGWC